MLGVETSIGSKVICITHVSYANHAHSPAVVSSREGRWCREIPVGVLLSGCDTAQMGGHNTQWLCQSGQRRIKSKGQFL